MSRLVTAKVRHAVAPRSGICGLVPPHLLPVQRVRDFGDGYSKQIPALFAKLCDGPLVLSHADWRLDNLFFTDADDVIAVDWQLIDRSVGPRDLAYLVTGSLDIPDPADYRQAFDTDLSDLAEHGARPDAAEPFAVSRPGTPPARTRNVAAWGVGADPRRSTPACE